MDPSPGGSHKYARNKAALSGDSTAVAVGDIPSSSPATAAHPSWLKRDMPPPPPRSLFDPGHAMGTFRAIVPSQHNSPGGDSYTKNRPTALPSMSSSLSTPQEFGTTTTTASPGHLDHRMGPGPPTASSLKHHANPQVGNPYPQLDGFQNDIKVGSSQFSARSDQQASATKRPLSGGVEIREPLKRTRTESTAAEENGALVGEMNQLEEEIVDLLKEKEGRESRIEVLVNGLRHMRMLTKENRALLKSENSSLRKENEKLRKDNADLSSIAEALRTRIREYRECRDKNKELTAQKYLLQCQLGEARVANRSWTSQVGSGEDGVQFTAPYPLPDHNRRPQRGRWRASCGSYPLA